MIPEVRLREPDLVLLVCILRAPFLPLRCIDRDRSSLAASDAIVALHALVVGTEFEVGTDDGGRRTCADREDRGEAVAWSYDAGLSTRERSDGGQPGQARRS